jgi:hypothetical protein
MSNTTDSTENIINIINPPRKLFKRACLSSSEKHCVLNTQRAEQKSNPRVFFSEDVRKTVCSVEVSGAYVYRAVCEYKTNHSRHQQLFLDPSSLFLLLQEKWALW